MSSKLAELDREILSRAPDPLYRLVKMAWHLVESVEYKDNWHVPALCERLQAVSNGEITRLVINQPPGTQKSLTVSVFWNLWEWTLRPETKWMYASYDAGLPARDARRVLNVIQTDWWRERWPECELTSLSPAVTNIETTAGGFRFSTSTGGKATGRHSDIQVCDDPHKPKELTGSIKVAKKAIETVSTWWKGTMSSRAADPATFRRVIMMQRLHEDDIAGEMLREAGYEHFCIPMRKESVSVQCPCGIECTPEDTREEGELLWPSRFPEDIVKQLETTGMGPTIAAAQLQQRPTPAGGGIFKNGWFRYWHHQAGVRVPQDPKFPCRDKYCTVIPENEGFIIQSWDMSFKDTDGSDFVSCGVWLYAKPNFYLLDLLNARLSFVDTVQAVRDMSEKWPDAHTKLVEDKANGPAVMSQLDNEISGLCSVEPQGGKEARAHSISGYFFSGNVYIPHPDLIPGVWEYMTQLSTFPKAVNDDMVDQTSQALIHLTGGQLGYLDALEKIKNGTYIDPLKLAEMKGPIKNG